MKVSDPNLTSLTSAGASRTRETLTVGEGRNRAAESRERGGSDQVQLSSLGHRLRELSSNSPEHTARVAQLESAVASGRYQVDAKAVSAAMVNDALRPGLS